MLHQRTEPLISVVLGKKDFINANIVRQAINSAWNWNQQNMFREAMNIRIHIPNSPLLLHLGPRKKKSTPGNGGNRSKRK